LIRYSSFNFQKKQLTLQNIEKQKKK